MTNSAIYEGWVAHRRAHSIQHSFRYRVFMPLFDLDELPELLDPIPLWSARRPAPAWFRDRDYLGGGPLPLAERARDLAHARLGRRPAGPVRMLANVRYLGVGFNPVSFLFLHGEDGGGVDCVIAEVTNTPWGDRTAYVLDGRSRGDDGPIRSRFEKRMHVSPFQPMDQTYEIRVGDPAEGLRVSIRNLEEEREVFIATMALRRRELTGGRLVRLLLAHPPMPLATLARIYANAWRLKRKGAPYFQRPRPAEDEIARLRTTQPPARSRAVSPLERISHQPQQRRPEPHEQCAALRVAPLALIVCLCPDPQADAQEHRAHRGQMQVPAPQTAAMDQIDQHDSPYCPIGHLLTRGWAGEGFGVPSTSHG